MKILAVSDETSAYYYDYYTPGRLAEFDLIIACGDLKKKYLEFLVTMGRAPLLYVRGNHDDSYKTAPPEGCIDIDGKIYEYNGIRILGLGGSYKYRDGENMYTEKQMNKRASQILKKDRLKAAISRRQKTEHRIDILVTHSPARGLNDMDDIAHRGFECFNDLLDTYHPKYFIHGHVHRNYGANIPQVTYRGDTCVVNACGYCKIDY